MYNHTSLEQQLRDLAEYLNKGKNIAPQVMLEVQRMAADARLGRSVAPATRRMLPCVARYAAALAVSAAILLVALFVLGDRQASAWAQVVETVAKKPWLHYITTHNDGTKMEGWFSARRSILTGRFIKVASKFTVGGDREGRVMIDISQNTRDWYDPEKNLIIRTTDDPFRKGADCGAIFLAFLSGDPGKTIDAGRFHLALEQQRSITEGGKSWTEYRFVKREKDENALYKHEWIISVDPNTQLPFQWKQVELSPSDSSRVSVISRSEIDYPSSGPEDIYALGVPETAKIVDRTLRSDVERLAREIASPRHWADDKFSALVITSAYEMQQWWQAYHIDRVWKDGLRWRCDQSMGPLAELCDKPPPKATDRTEWWRQMAKKVPFRPDSLCDGQWYWEYDTKTRAPTPADTSAGWPKHTRAVVSIKSRRQNPVQRDYFRVAYPLGSGCPPDPLNYFHLIPGYESSVDPKPKSGPPDTVLLETRNPYWKPLESSEFSEIRNRPQVWRFWIDPTRDYLVVRCEELITRNGKELLTNGFVIEAVVQDPRGRWYPSVVRRFKCYAMIGTDKWEDGILRFYYDFTTPIPDSVFDAATVERLRVLEGQ